jgi:hypothetical protein
MFLLVGIITLIFVVIVPLLARSKKVEPSPEAHDAQSPPKEPPHAGRPGSTGTGRKAA